MLQAGKPARGACPSGVTPGRRDTEPKHRVSIHGLHPSPLTPDETRWSTRPLFVASRKEIARRLAGTIATGPLTAAEIAARSGWLAERPPGWLRRLAARVAARFGGGPRPAIRRLTEFIGQDPALARAHATGKVKAPPLLTPDPVMAPAAGALTQWPVPPVVRVGDLAGRLNLTPGELEWFADCRSLERKVPAGPLRHYRYRWQQKRQGSARLVEAPKPRLKAIQRFLLRQLLEVIPPHPAAHGFRRERSVLTFVAPHTARDLVLRLDLRDFFPSIGRPRVEALFRTVGYPATVARQLAGLCTNATPPDILRASPQNGEPGEDQRRRHLYGRPHLPQGAPTSPALANLCAYRLDCRLAGLALASGVSYTRYADDLVFSGGPEFRRSVQRFYVQVGAIALEEGFEVHARKTRVMGRAASQRAAGLVLNEHPNLPRSDYDRLKAILHDCLRRGSAPANRFEVPDFRSHLTGRVAYAERVNPQRGRKLRMMLERIAWSD